MHKIELNRKSDEPILHFITDEKKVIKKGRLFMKVTTILFFALGALTTSTVFAERAAVKNNPINRGQIISVRGQFGSSEGCELAIQGKTELTDDVKGLTTILPVQLCASIDRAVFLNGASKDDLKNGNIFTVIGEVGGESADSIDIQEIVQVKLGKVAMAEKLIETPFCQDLMKARYKMTQEAFEEWGYLPFNFRATADSFIGTFQGIDALLMLSQVTPMTPEIYGQIIAKKKTIFCSLDIFQMTQRISMEDKMFGSYDGQSPSCSEATYQSINAEILGKLYAFLTDGKLKRSEDFINLKRDMLPLWNRLNMCVKKK